MKNLGTSVRLVRLLPQVVVRQIYLVSTDTSPCCHAFLRRQGRRERRDWACRRSRMRRRHEASDQVDDDGNIVDSCFKTFGCGSAIASSSVVTEWVKGQHIDEAVTIKNSEIAKHLNLPPVKLHCSMLAEDAIKAAVEDLRNKNARLPLRTNGTL